MAKRIKKNPKGVTLDQLFGDEIDSVKNAVDVSGLAIDSSVMRNKAETEFVGILKLEEKYINAWKSYYAKQQEMRTAKGLSPATPTLELNDEQVLRKAKITVKQARELKTAIAKEMGIKDTKSLQIGHDDHGVAMDKAKILYDNVNVISEREKFKPGSSIFGITPEQKAYLGKAIVAAQSIERAPHSQIKELKRRFKTTTITDDVLLAYLSTVNEDVILNANFLSQTTSGGPKLQYDLTFQATEHNLESGDMTKLLGKRMSDMLKAVDKDTLETFRNSDFAWALMNVPGSPTWLRKVGAYLKGLITGKREKLPDSSHTKEFKVKNTANTRLRSEISKIKQLKKETLARIKNTKIKEPEKQLVGLFNVMGLINLVLAREIQAQMGKSSDPPNKLRYQTGRFAHSAKLLNLVHTKKNTIAGIYTYMHYPYDVFLPGHRLDNGLRNPKLYIEHGIRAAARTILEGRFPGIVLEPDR